MSVAGTCLPSLACVDERDVCVQCALSSPSAGWFLSSAVTSLICPHRIDEPFSDLKAGSSFIWGSRRTGAILPLSSHRPSLPRPCCARSALKKFLKHKLQKQMYAAWQDASRQHAIHMSLHSCLVSLASVFNRASMHASLDVPRCTCMQNQNPSTRACLQAPLHTLHICRP